MPPDVRETLIESLGDVYDFYENRKWWQIKFSFGINNENDPNHFERWTNFSTIMGILCFCTILFEGLQVLRFVLAIQGIKMKRGFLKKL